jgi:hypothetical protein
MERNGRPRRRPEAPSGEPTTLTECARRYHGAALALARTFGVPLTAKFLQTYHSAISSVYIESGRAGVRLEPTVQLPSLAPAGHLAPDLEADRDPLPPGEEEAPVVTTNGDGPPPPLPAADLPTHIPGGLPCAGQAIDALKPAQLHMLCGKLGLRALVDPGMKPLHEAVLAERSRRLEAGKRAEVNGHAP